MKASLRHLRVFLAVAEHGSITRAAEIGLVSQPAVTQAVAKLERAAETALFQRTPQGLFPTDAGAALANRVRRALGLLDPALAALAPRLRTTATVSQLQALIAMREIENFTLAARRLGVAQPTVHRAITQLEEEAGRALFERTPHGMLATRPAQALAQAARLAFAELDQAAADVAESAGREVGRIVVGAMPLARSRVLPAAIAGFRRLRPRLPILILDGRYDELLAGLRRGEIDMLIGALREPAPIGDVEQRELFRDSLALVCGSAHPLAGAAEIAVAALARYPWVVARAGTPTRAHFDRLFAGGPAPASIVESGSVVLMRELLDDGVHLGCISRLQARAEADRGSMTILPFDMPETSRPIGLTLRAGWLPTRAQGDFLDQLRPPGDGA
jgi:DNA-binding transcriptional LysR family regulator